MTYVIMPWFESSSKDNKQFCITVKLFNHQLCPKLNQFWHATNIYNLYVIYNNLLVQLIIKARIRFSNNELYFDMACLYDIDCSRLLIDIPSCSKCKSNHLLESFDRELLFLQLKYKQTHWWFPRFVSNSIN